MQFWSDIANRHGGIARVPLMRGQVAYLVSDRDLLYELLVTNRHKYRKNIRCRAAIELFGHGLLLNEGGRVEAPAACEPAGVPSRLRRRPGAVDGRAHGRRARGLAAVCRRRARLQRRRRVPAPLAASRGLLPHGPRLRAHRRPFLPRRGDGFGAALAAAVRDVEACLYECLAAERAADFAGAGLVETLVDGSRAQSDEFDDKSLRDQLLTVFFAGHETTATSVSWIHCLFDAHRDARAKLKVWVDRVLRRRMPTSADLDARTYTKQIINETLRLYSTIHSISRLALVDDTLGGYRVLAGVTIYVSLHATHRPAKLWPEPHRFDAERFTPNEVARRPRFAFIPFTAGHRNCIGGMLAIAELKLAVAMTAQRYEPTLTHGQRVEGTAGMTMHPRYGMTMRIRAI